MQSITVFSATNRPASRTFQVAEYYKQMLNGMEQQVKFLSFMDLPHDLAFSDCFGKRSAAFSGIIENYIHPSSHFVFVMPEYNGSFPGILKTFLDAVHPKEWMDKKAALVGVSQGRAGNLRGLDQLTMVLQYLKMHVYYLKIPISVVDSIVQEDGSIFHEETINVLTRQATGFLKF